MNVPAGSNSATALVMPSGWKIRSSVYDLNDCPDCTSMMRARRLYPVFEYEYSEPGGKSRSSCW